MVALRDCYVGADSTPDYEWRSMIRLRITLKICRKRGTRSSLSGRNGEQVDRLRRDAKRHSKSDVLDDQFLCHKGKSYMLASIVAFGGCSNVSGKSTLRPGIQQGRRANTVAT
jgi:hypothetical protein